ncbi:MAG: hypothetical protein JWQ80_2040 [Massilia sp.]|nr:hypothetical protein [Massilia sp.]
MECLSGPNIWIGFFTLVVLEIVVGIDNLIFIAILAEKLPPEQRDRARLLGLSLAMLMRVGLLTRLRLRYSKGLPVRRDRVLGADRGAQPDGPAQCCEGRGAHAAARAHGRRHPAHAGGKGRAPGRWAGDRSEPAPGRIRAGRAQHGQRCAEPVAAFDSFDHDEPLGHHLDRHRCRSPDHPRADHGNAAQLLPGVQRAARRHPRRRACARPDGRPCTGRHDRPCARRSSFPSPATC